MKRWILYILILIAVVVAPVRPINIGQLLPVQTVLMRMEGQWIVIETDTGNKGIGSSGFGALQNLKETAGGLIYLDTAQYLLLAEGAEEAAEELRTEFRKSVELCAITGQPDLPQVAKYLQVHADLPKLKSWKKDMKLPVLWACENSVIFLKKVENKA